jgi:hypothetical protein
MDDAPGSAAEPTELTLIPEVEARRALAGRMLRLSLLMPPYLAAGVGALRILRVIERPGAADLIAGYERYERLDTANRPETPGTARSRETAGRAETPGPAASNEPLGVVRSE